jgi:hypothetical protein
MTTGYRHPLYAASLAEHGTPRRLPASDGWILERDIPGFTGRDAMGCYPLFCCGRWDRLADDLRELGDGLVSLTLVTDPFGPSSPAILTAFNRGAVAFKEHLVVDLSGDPERAACSHHRRNARKALRQLTVEPLGHPADHLGEWVGLYDTLIERHAIDGLRAFSETAFARQLEVPGLVALRAAHAGRSVGMLLWYVQGEVAHYHLGAFSEEGYRLGASFALFWSALEWFRGKVAWLNLGAGAGLGGGVGDGLTRFKQGWASGARTAYLCRHVGDPVRYGELTRERGTEASHYFPAYRVGEFARPVAVSR